MGQIITFYSYKGGTGRSMALANVAWILASRHKRVLAVDWDLEAPGLHRYLAPFLVDKDLGATKGVIDFIRGFAIQSATPPPEGKPRPADWFRPQADIVDYAVSLRWDYFRPGTLDFIPAGQQDGSYPTRVNSFNWDNFYDRLGGGTFLEAAKEYMREQYDYVLIDSRTGVSDTSGICTVQMPDTVVVCFTLNNQSIEGAASITQSILAQRTDESGRSRVRVLPVPTRVDSFEKVKLDRRRAYAKERFAGILAGLPETYWADVEIPYWPFYAYEEILATFGDQPGGSNTMLRAFEGLTRHLSNGEVETLAPPPEAERAQVLRDFEETGGRETPAERVASSARPLKHDGGGASRDLYLSVHPAEEALTQPLRQALGAAYLSDIADSAATWASPQWAQGLHESMAKSRAFVWCEGSFGLNPWQLRELAYALRHQKRQRAEGKEFPCIPVMLPTASASVFEDSWLASYVVDQRRKTDVTAASLMARRLAEGKMRSFPPGVSPYKGEAAYQEWDVPLFFGREEECERLLQDVSSGKVVFLRGGAGSGKTSLLNAGVKPQLRTLAPPSPVWEVVSITPATSPLRDLAAALVSLWLRDANETNRLGEITNVTRALSGGAAEIQSVLRLVFDRTPRVDRLLIVVDQMERLFSAALERERQPFLDALSAAAESPAVTLLIATRPEWEAELIRQMPAWRWALDAGLELEAMPPAEIYSAIVGPAHIAGIDIEEIPIDTWVASLAFEPGGLFPLSLATEKLGKSGAVPENPAQLAADAMESYLGTLSTLDRSLVLSAAARLVEWE